MRLLLILANCWFLNPVGYAVTVDPQNLDWSSNISGVLVDLTLNKLTDGSEPRNVPVKRTIGRTHEVFVTIRAPSGTSAYYPCYMLWVNQREADAINNQLPKIVSVDRNGCDRSILGRKLARSRIGVKDAIHQWLHLFGKRLSSALKSFTRPQGSVNYAAKIVSPRTIHAYDGKIQIAGSDDLASIWQNAAVLISGTAIRRNHYLFIGPHKRESGAMRKALGKGTSWKNIKQSQPSWVRHRYLGGLVWCSADEHNIEFCDADSEDIDVSLDGKKWFHAIGTYCSDGLPDWKFCMR